MQSVAFLALVASLLPALAAAQSPIYGQCGGIGWSKYLNFICHSYRTHGILQREPRHVYLARPARFSTLITLNACKEYSISFFEV